MPVAGPFYLAYVVDDTVPFDRVAHAVMDEYVFRWKRILSETDKPVLELEMKNPHIGLLNTSRMQWAWLSWLNPNTGLVEPLFLGRIVGNPNNALAEVIIVQFVSWPTDYFARQQRLAETLKVTPFWDEVFVAVEKSDDPNTILESRGSLWCVDPITLEVTAEDIIDASDGNVDITADQHFYDALDMHDGDAPLTAVLIDATVSWTQTGRGYIDMGSRHIITYGGDGLIGDWPKPLTSLGSGWTVADAVAFDYNNVAAATTGTISYSWQSQEKEHNDGDTLSISYSQTAPADGSIGTILTEIITVGLLDPFAVDGDGDPSPINKPAGYENTSAWVLGWNVATSLILRYDLSRQRTERVRIFLTADLQPVINDPLVTQYSETITMTGRDVGVPIVNLLNWTTLADSNVGIDQVIFPDDPKLPGGRSAQVSVVAGHTGTVEPNFSDIPGDITIDGTVHWASMGTQSPTEGAQDWTGFTNFNPGAMILPRQPLYTTYFVATTSGRIAFPPQGTSIPLDRIVQSNNGSFFVCTLDGLTNINIKDPFGGTSTFGATVNDGAVEWTCLGSQLPDGKTYYITPNGGQSGVLYVIPPFGEHTTLHDQVNDNGVKWVSIGSGDIPAGGTPGNVWARSYFATDRGKQSLEYLLTIGRAHIRKRARAVELEFECSFELGVDITCRKTVTLHDSRIPGGLALGKVTRAELSADGDTGEVKCHVTIGCVVGRDNAVTTVPGTGVYASDGYMQSGYQQETGSVVVLPDLTDVGYTPIVAAPDDDGLVLPLDKAQVVISEGIKGDFNLQSGAVHGALKSMALAAREASQPITSFAQAVARNNVQTLLSTNSISRALQLYPIYYEAQLKPVVNGPFFDSYVVQTQMMTLPKGIDLEGDSTLYESDGFPPKVVSASQTSIAVASDSASASGGSPSTVSASQTSTASAMDAASATGGGSSLASPVISKARPAKASFAAFDVSSGGTIKSNHIEVFGTAAASASVHVFVNGSGPTTVTADGSGNWVCDIGLLSNASQSITATQTSSSVTSPASSAFTFTVAALITTFSTVPSSTFTINGETHEVEGAGQTWSLQKPDSHTLRFEVRPGDRWSGGGDGTYLDRSEVQNDTWLNHQFWGANIPANTPISLYYELMIEPNSGGSFVNTQNISNGWFIVGQMHNDDIASGVPTSPPLAISMDGAHLQVLRRNVGPSVDPSNSGGHVSTVEAWRDASVVTPNVYRAISIEVNFDNAGSGYLRVWVDGVQVVNYVGQMGYGDPTYWEWGIYRSTATEHAAANYRNMIHT